MPRLDLPLIGLLEDSILPGEDRTFTLPAVDLPALTALGRLFAESSDPPRVLALTIASPVELPSLVTSRWGTECTLLAADGSSITLRGLRRDRLLSARGKESPYKSEVDVPADEPEPPIADLVTAAGTLLSALSAGAIPEAADWPERLRPALLALGRALAGRDALADLTQHPPAEALTRLARSLTARAPGEHASRDLEQAMRELTGKTELPKALRHRLWSQVVELQKRLDVYDPTVAEEGDDTARLQRRLSQAGLPKVARDTAKRELRLLRSMQSNHHDYSTFLSHLDFMARLPWQPDPPKPISLEAVQAALDRGHSGLPKAKTRVLEYLAVRALGGENASMILCLSGPPGVGKTSIASAIAGALGRPFVRIPLGGVHDESEVRGHRVSYVGAGAGRILRGIAQAGSASALVLLDEIDKIGSDQQRSPMAALLEVLDPEQNREFQDNYLGVSYDLSHVLFVATANDTSQIHPTLLDRLEPVEIDGYTVREKTDIARHHLLDRLRAENGLPAAPAIDDDALALIIEGHTRESGVRQLRRALASIYRGRALEIVRAGEAADPAAAARPVSRAEVDTVLGPARFAVQRVDEALPVGVATGLSVGPGGGAILLVEVGLSPGRGELTLTGRLGDVLQESVRAALGHLRVAPERYGLTRERVDGLDVHVHLPDAATAKDGPSAGTAVFAALVSALSGTALPADLAFTGEISLTGRVLPVGGVRAKVLAAERAGVRRVLLPEGNRADVPADVALDAVFVRTLDEVFRAAFAGAANPGLIDAERDPMPTLPQIASYEELRAIGERALEMFELLTYTDEDDEDDDSPLDDATEERHRGGIRVATEALRFVAVAAGQLGDVRLTPLVVQALVALADWDDHMSGPTDAVSDGLTGLLQAGAVVDEGIEALALDDNARIRTAVAKGLKPHGARSLALLEKLAVDSDASVRKPARASLALAREIPWWLGKFESDPLARLLPEEAERHKKAFEELSKLLDMPRYNLMERDEQLAALIGSLPDPLAVEAARLVLTVTDRYSARLPRLGTMMVSRSGGLEAMIRLCEAWGAIESFYLQPEHFLFLADAPPEPRLRVSLGLAQHAAEQPSVAGMRGHGNPIHIMAELAGKGFPPGGDLNPFLDICLSRDPGMEVPLDWVVAGLRSAFDSPGADPRPIADRLLEARLAGFPGAWRRLHSGLDGLLRRLPLALLRPAAERAVLTDDDNTVGWGLQMLLLEAHDPARDPEPLELARRFYEEPRTRKPLVTLPVLGYLVVSLMRESLRKDELEATDAYRLASLVSELYGGMWGMVQNPLVPGREGEREAAQEKLRQRYAAFLGPEDLRGPLREAEWDALRRAREAHPRTNWTDWVHALAAIPAGPWHPADREVFDEALELCEDGEEDLVYHLAMALCARPSEEDLPLFERLLRVAPDQRSTLRQCLVLSREALGLPTRVEGSATGQEPIAREWMDEEDDEEGEDDEEDDDED